MEARLSEHHDRISERDHPLLTAAATLVSVIT
jgi:hypothetical protein